MEQDPSTIHDLQGTRLEQDAVVTLNVGGVPYQTTLSTLTSIPSSYFCTLLSGRWQPLCSPNGDVFVDRDGQVFKYILQYLRAVKNQDTSFDLPSDRSERHTLQVEAQFYCLVHLADMLKTNASAPLVLAASGSGPAAGGVLLSSLAQSQQLYRQCQAEWTADEQLQDMLKLVMDHLLLSPLAAKQMDLAVHLAEGRGALALSISHYPLGALRFQVNAILVGVTGSGADCGDGTAYAITKIKEQPGSYITETSMLGETDPVVVTVPRPSNKDVPRFTMLHKLLVHKTPRPTYLGLLWLLEQQGFREVAVKVQQLGYLPNGPPDPRASVPLRELHQQYAEATITLGI